MTEENLPCFVCGRPSLWFYMPFSSMPEEERYSCDKHVPRNCFFCNSDDDGNESPKPWAPCIDWWPIVENKTMKQKFRAYFKPDFQTKDGPIKFIAEVIPNTKAYFVAECDPEIKYPFLVPFIDDDWVVQQWTGLRDLDNEEIFEGDLLKFRCSSQSLNLGGAEKEWSVEVLWDEESAGFIVRDIEEKQRTWEFSDKDSNGDPFEFKIIANIFEK